MKPVTLTAAAVAALALAAPTTAKEPIRATICGHGACATVTDRATLEGIPGGESTVPLGAAAPYFRIEMVAGDPAGDTHSFFFYYVPSADATAWEENGTVALHPIYGEPTKALMRKLTAGLVPFPPPKAIVARVGNRTVTGRDARTYLRLFALESNPGATTQSSDWLPIDLRSPTPSPWTDAPVEFSYSREDDAFIRGWRVVELDATTAANLESARALDATPRGESRRWALALGGFGALSLVLVVGGFSARRRR